MKYSPVPREPFCTALLLKDERGRFLSEVLDWHGRYGPLVVLDDNSTDGTYEFCRDHPAVIRCERRDPDTGMWGNESPARAHLWRLAAESADAFLICDGDQLLSADPRPLLQTQNLNAWAFPLYDLWDARDTYREDGFWRGHLHPRPWLFFPHRVPEGYKADWSTRGIHCGHSPSNLPLALQTAPSEFYWLHLAYMLPGDRDAKLTKYRSQYHQMTDFEQAHAESIADPQPSLRVLPFAKPVKILVGAPVRKNAAVLQAHLDSLIAQELPPRVTLDFLFVDDYPTPDPAQQVLAEFVQANGGRVVKSENTNTSDFTDQHPVTHQWTASAMNRMAFIKNGILKACVDGDYDFVFLVDSDLILDRTTLASLLAAQKPVVAAVYWTRWNADPVICAGPQVWLKPVYELSLPHYPEHEFRAKLGVERNLERVGGLGACTLIARHVIEKGVNFSKPPEFPSGGLWDGEDRHFCEWARRMHVDLYADAWPDIFHIYHPKDADRIPEMTTRLGATHPTFANHGHLVNLRLTNVEDLIGPVNVRCRMGDGTLLPELEQHLQAMQRGEEKLVRVHFPSTTPLIPTSAGMMTVAGQSRLIKIELIDCKPAALPPVLEDEFYVVDGVLTVQDKTQLTKEQHQLIGAGS